MENLFEHKYPNENLHELDLTWLNKEMQELKAAYSAFLAANSLTFADPIIWDITKQYSKNTIVLSSEGDAFLSKQPVGSGIQLNNTDYWLEIFNFADYIRTANSNLTMHIEQNTTRATDDHSVDDWLLWEDVLYKVTAPISDDDLLIIGTNIVHFTVEDFCRAWQTYMINTIAQYKADIDASELAYKNEIDASELAYRNQLAQDITTTTASLQAQLNLAISGATVDSEVINARLGADGITYDTLGNAIRTQFDKVAYNFLNGNVYNVAIGGVDETTYEGITYTKNNDGSVTLAGTSTATSIYNIYMNTNDFPEGITPGSYYSLVFNPTNSNITLRIYVYMDGDWCGVEWFGSNNIFYIPSDATGIIIRLGVPSGITVDETVYPFVFTALTNDDLQKYIMTVENTVKTAIIPTFKKGGITASYNIEDNINAAYALNIDNPSDIYLAQGFYCHIGLYRNNGYLGKIAADDSINKTAGDWKNFTGHINISKYLKRENANGIWIVITTYNGYSFSDDATANTLANDIVKIFTDKYHIENAIDDSIEALIRDTKNPLLPYYNKFRYGSISTVGNTISYNPINTNVRASVVAHFDKPFYITTVNHDYMIGLYWYDENNTLHSKLWDTTWEVPAGVDVGISIKRHEYSSNPEIIVNETPWIYLMACESDDTPIDIFQSEIDDTVEKVRAVQTEPCLTYIMSTDQHFMTVINWLYKYNNIYDMVNNMKAVLTHIHADAAVSLGDIADFKVPYSTAVAARFGITDLSYSNLDNIFAHWRNYAIDKIVSVHPNFIYTDGNHDDNRYINSEYVHDAVSLYDYTPEQMYSYYFSRCMNRVSDPNSNMNYHIDYDDLKIRVIVISSNYYDADTNSWNYGYSDNTVSYIENILNTVPSGYQVLIFSHMSPIYSHNGDNYQYYNFDAVEAKIQAFISGGGDLIALMYGHSHVDWDTTSPWLDITYACQKVHATTPQDNMPGAVAPTRTANTAEEDCWNVIVIRPVSRKINIIRFGAGSDREFNY